MQTWVKKIYSDLDEMFKSELKKYNITTEEIVKLVFYKLREHLTSKEYPDILLHHLGTFSVRIPKMWKEMHTLREFLNDGVFKDEMYKIKLEKLKTIISAYNKKLINKHQWRVKHYNYNYIELLEEEIDGKTILTFKLTPCWIE